MRKIFLSLLALGLVLLANAQIALASGTLSYQPEVPEELKERS